MHEKKQRHFIKLSYVGTGFAGWQIQPGSPTIQRELNQSLSLILQEEIHTTGAGRTDTGVHARCFYAHADLPLTNGQLDTSWLVYKLNRLLPHGVAVLSVFPVQGDAHARFDAISRTYHYYICTQKDPFMHGRAWLMTRRLNLENMQKAADMLLDFEDFGCFARSNTQVKTNLCHVISAQWEAQDQQLVFKITANRFLRNMVRSIVGTMVDMGLDRLSLDGFREVIESGDRKKAGYSAPACGLYLWDVQYPFIY